MRFGMSMIFLMRPNVRRSRMLFATWADVDKALLIASPVFDLPPSLQFDRAAGLFELLLDRLGLGLGHGFLDRLRRSVDEVLRLLETEAGELAHHLDDLDLLVARAGEDDREVLLLGHGRRRTAGRRGTADRRHRNGRGRRHAELALELLHEGGG